MAPQEIIKVDQSSSVKIAVEIDQKIVLRSNTESITSNDRMKTTTSNLIILHPYLQRVLFYKTGTNTDSKTQTVYIEFNKPILLEQTSIEKVQNNHIVWFATIRPCSFKKIYSRFTNKSLMVSRKAKLLPWAIVCPDHFSKQELFDKANDLAKKSEFLNLENNLLKKEKAQLQQRIDTLESELHRLSKKRRISILDPSSPNSTGEISYSSDFSL